MVVTTRVRLDRISSATRNAALTPEVIVGDQIVSAEGYVLAVRILADKSTYNTVEDVTGRMLSLRGGDVLAGVLGTRRALRGYAGVVPPRLAVGDTIEVLNLGGILGTCTSVNPEIGPPFQAEVLGAILAFPELGDRIGRPAHIRDRAVPPADSLESRVPVVYVAGTCMNAGKTVAATELVRGLARGGLRIAAAKLTGVSLMRDALSMLDAGALVALTFNDVGIASTHPGVTVNTAKGIFNRLAGAKPDVIVAELGDGILGEYGVQDILRDELGYQGVILSDDLEMKAIARSCSVPDAAVQAIAAGCDGVLICSGDVEVQAATLEALVHAFEDGRIPFKRLEDALKRLRGAKERFLTAPVAVQAPRLQHVLGCDAHQRIAEEMSRFL